MLFFKYMFYPKIKITVSSALNKMNNSSVESISLCLGNRDFAFRLGVIRLDFMALVFYFNTFLCFQTKMYLD